MAEGMRVEMADRAKAINHGGIGLMHPLARQSGLVEAIDRHLHLLKIHRPYHESDHVLNFACNALCGGIRLEDIELRRNDEARLSVWARQPDAFFERATIDMDGTLTVTTGECKQGMDIS